MKTTILFGPDSFTKTWDHTPTFREIVSDGTLRAALGFGDNVRPLVGSVEQPLDNVVPDGVTIRLESRANAKAS